MKVYFGNNIENKEAHKLTLKSSQGRPLTHENAPTDDNENGWTQTRREWF